MKKILPCLCLTLLAASLASCTKDNTQSSTDVNSSESQISTDAPISSAESSIDSASEESSEESSSSAEPVVTKATIKSIQALGTYTTSNIVLGGIAEEEEYEIGSDVTVSFTAGTTLSYMDGISATVASRTYVYVNDVEYHPTVDAGSTSMSVTFKMPKEGASIVYLYNGYEIVDEANGVTWSISNLGSFKVYGLSATTKYTSPNFYLVGPESTTLSSASYVLNDAAGTSEAIDFVESNGVYNLSPYLSSANGATTATITLDTSVAQEYKITYTGLDSAKYDAVSSILPTVGYSGKSVTVKAVANEAYYISSMTISGVTATPFNGSVTFTMPENDVAINVAFADKLKASVTIASGTDYVKDYYFINTTTNQHTLYFKPGEFLAFHVILVDFDHEVTSLTFDGIAPSYGISKSTTTIDGVEYPDYSGNFTATVTSVGNISIGIAEIVTLTAEFNITGEDYIREYYFADSLGNKKEDFTASTGENLMLYIILKNDSCTISVSVNGVTADGYSSTVDKDTAYIAYINVPSDATSLNITIAASEKVVITPSVTITSGQEYIEEYYFYTTGKLTDPKFVDGDYFSFYVVLKDDAHYVSSITINGEAAYLNATTMDNKPCYYASYTISGATSLTVAVAVEEKPTATVEITSGSDYIKEYYFYSYTTGKQDGFRFKEGDYLTFYVVLNSDQYEVTSVLFNGNAPSFGYASTTTDGEPCYIASYSVPTGTTSLSITVAAGVKATTGE